MTPELNDARTRKPSALWRLPLLLLAGLVGAGCRHEPSAGQPMAKLIVGVSALRISLPLFVAAQRGLYARHGLDVEVRSYVTAQPMIDDVVLGKVDAAGYAAYPIVFLSSKGAARPPRLATALVEDKADRLSYVLARKGSGLHFPADARGKRIGILPTVAYQRWLDAILRAAGVPPSSVTVVPLAPAMQAQAIAEGGVDLLFTNDPMATAALASGRAEIADDGPPCATRLGEPFPFGGFVLSGALAHDRPEVAARLVAAIDEAIAEVRADPAAARQAMTKYVRPEEAAFVDRYPPSRYLTSTEVPARWLADEAAHERSLGILDAETAVAPWTQPVSEAAKTSPGAP